MNKRKAILTAMVIAATAASASAQDAAVSANLLGLADLGTMGADVSAAVSRRVTADAGICYNPWTFTRGGSIVQDRRRQVSAGVSLWPWHVLTGIHLGAGVQWREYNRGGLLSPSAEEGDAFGIYAEAGISRMIHHRWNISASAGAWAGRRSWTSYSCPVCGRITGGGTGPFVEPARFRISVDYIIRTRREK